MIKKKFYKKVFLKKNFNKKISDKQIERNKKINFERNYQKKFD